MCPPLFPHIFTAQLMGFTRPESPQPAINPVKPWNPNFGSHVSPRGISLMVHSLESDATFFSIKYHVGLTFGLQYQLSITRNNQLS
ncbi:hypothetical protein EPI10_001153 [Gossypium australe]|uniref:Uncharacterized protein n=1 Tax=Gossypium australe TaxID=47621 RepID=A0A5B6VAL6_9ROSI|nr:hypothetical protein EPI10_001153 [Gossypium australe]